MDYLMGLVEERTKNEILPTIFDQTDKKLKTSKKLTKNGDNRTKKRI
jgi:hypothetical protein